MQSEQESYNLRSMRDTVQGQFVPSVLYLRYSPGTYWSDLLFGNEGYFIYVKFLSDWICFMYFYFFYKSVLIRSTFNLEIVFICALTE